MTQPRPIIANKFYLLTRRCAQRQLLLQPSKLTAQVFTFCLGWAASVTGVEVHAVCVLGNHYHAVVSDPEGRLPEFMEHLHKFVAKCLNAHLGRWENLWALEQPCTPELVDDQAVLDKLLYTLANPVSSLLVQRGDLWPGVRLGPESWGKGTAVDRPTVFFREDGPVPAQVELKLTRPPVCTEQSDAELARTVEQAVADHETELREEARSQGKRFLGVKGVKQQSPFAFPKGQTPRRGLRPTVACHNKWRRVEALGRQREFLVAYRAALDAWRGGDREVVFPEGTYALRLRAGVSTGPPG